MVIIRNKPDLFTASIWTKTNFLWVKFWRHSNATSLFRYMSVGWIVLKFTGLISASKFFYRCSYRAVCYHWSTEVLLMKSLKKNWKLNVSPHNDMKSQEILLLRHLLEGMYHHFLTLNPISISSHSKKKNPFGYFTYIGRYIKRVIQEIKSFYKHQ